MTGEEQELLTHYLTHLNLLGPGGAYPDFDTWYEEIRYARGAHAPQTLEEASDLRLTTRGLFVNKRQHMLQYRLCHTYQAARPRYNLESTKTL